MSTEQTFHMIGKRDAVAEMLMMVRTFGAEKAVHMLAESLPDNVHAKWIKKNLPNKL